MNPDQLILLIPVFPFMGFLVNGLMGHRFSRTGVGLIATLMPAMSFLITVSLFMELATGGHPGGLHQTVFSWISVGDLNLDFALAFDSLTAIMCLVVTGVGSLIHLYSVGYMAQDRSPARYFAYLNLFMFSMLILVLADNLPLMFVGWEGVGLCSYLLIGFWYEDIEKAKAGKKAFVVNRIGDFGFLLGIFSIFVVMQSLITLAGHPGSGVRIDPETIPAIQGMKFSAINHLAPYFANTTLLGLGGVAVATLITLFLFVGATGKSAQIPLYVWLPDAMAGPTPVSALIHAATMVTAGVYMIARLSGLFSEAPATLAVVATVGAATALYAGTIAITQNDLKKILAYSTVSQLGYMFLGMGVAAYGAGVFHLMTHAFFKACLFLGAGSVMHAVEHAFHKAGVHGDPLNVQHMGGLRKAMPRTFWTMLIATVAIAGIPPFAGFFSKDEILWKTLEKGMNGNSWFLVLYGMGLAGAAVTAFYMFRMLSLAFLGSWRGKPEVEKAVHESPAVMTGVLVVLAVLSVVGGFVQLPGFVPEAQWLDGFLGFEHAPAAVAEHGEKAAAHGAEAAAGHGASTEVAAAGASVAIAALACLLGWFVFTKKLDLAKRLAFDVPVVRAAYRMSLNKYWVDEIYEALIIRPIYYGAVALWLIADVVLVDGLLVNGTGVLVKGVAGGLRRLQFGLLNMYALVILGGALAVLWYFLLMVMN